MLLELQVNLLEDFIILLVVEVEILVGVLVLVLILDQVV